ncbi:hypothetical protein [Paenibacillus radicis (ex Xue et al. 2023)]|uniref:UDP-N-acetylmuramyl pentapeptide phosphotransferase n=1 Tax=Paenibacillus radicis (ex Xue et al. 2023) TaxID=2972489 RepID=A0ABT1YL36_9BACL|nr:hypothetical protein [Paenibacillus radicis (ex Xue et al. 2023)]MCR8633886.1 hypothetical protein [Paenibacillus radicis (ex Xue et al. 2023)]
MLIVGIMLQCGVLALVGLALLPLVTRFMDAHGLFDRNYLGEAIPTACGLLLWLLLLVETVIISAEGRLLGTDASYLAQHYDQFLAYSMSLSVIALLGFIDDAVGIKEVKGIAEHWRLWKDRRLVSTGLLKAGGTAITAMVFVLQLTELSFIQWGCCTLLLMLMTNGMNLLDLRPGRALKCFFALSVIMLFSADHFGLWLLPFILPLMIGAILLFGPDLRGKLMLGDTGANMLGFAAGCWAILSAGWMLQTVLLILLLFLHLLTWRTSLSTLIERNRLLHWFDLLGRQG